MQNCDYHLIKTTRLWWGFFFRQGVSGHAARCVRMQRQKGYKYTPSARWSVCRPVGPSTGVSAGLQQHDVSRAWSTR